MLNESQQIYLKEKSPTILKCMLKKSNAKNRFNDMYIKSIKNKSNAPVGSIYLHVYHSLLVCGQKCMYWSPAETL